MPARKRRAFRDLPRAERELFWLEQAERALKELRDNFASKRQPYSFLADSLGEIVRERITVTAVVSGVPEARRLRANNR